MDCEQSQMFLFAFVFISYADYRSGINLSFVCIECCVTINSNNLFDSHILNYNINKSAVRCVVVNEIATTHSFLQVLCYSNKNIQSNFLLEDLTIQNQSLEKSLHGAQCTEFIQLESL